MKEKINKKDFHDWIDLKVSMSKVKEDHGKSHAEWMIQKTIEAFTQVHQIEEKGEDELLEQLSRLYSCNEEGCRTFVKFQKKAQPSKDSKLYILWQKRGRLARKYFGDELLETCWKN